MKILKNYLFILVSILMLASCSNSPKENDVADSIYTNGKIFTSNDNQKLAEAVAIKDGKFLFVGSSAEVMDYKGESTIVIDLVGKFVMPGLIDAHTHPFDEYHKEIFEAYLDASSEEALLVSVKKYADEHPEKEWITGGLWPFGMFENNDPSRELLDKIIPDRPVMLIDQGGHAAWLNTKAHEIIGFMDKDFEVPAKVGINRDENGVPSGVVTEFALGYARKFIPEVELNEWVETARGFQPIYHKYGLVATAIAAADESHLKAATQLEKNNELEMHLTFHLHYDYYDSQHSFEDQLKLIEKAEMYDSELIDAKGVKIFVDGSPVSLEARMLDPYVSREGYYGVSYYTAEELSKLYVKFEKMNRTVMTHAIGDKTIRDVLDAIEMAKKANPDSKIRHHLSHNTLMHPDEVKRYAELDVVCEISPIMVLSPGLIEMFDEIFGRKILLQGWNLRDVIDAGGTVAMASDWKSSPLDPWLSIGWVVSRYNAEFPDMEEIKPGSNITIEEALKAYTIGPAYALSKEITMGSIETGKYADMAILNVDLLELDPKEIASKTEVLETIFMGKSVYKKK